MRQEHGGNIYEYEGKLMLDFSANVNALPMPESVFHAMQESLCMVDKYPDPLCRKLREKVANRYQLDANHILFGNGAADLIHLLVECIRPKRALLVAPSFLEYRNALVARDCEVFYHFPSQRREFALDESYLEEVKHVMPDILFLCSPSNPVGNLISKKLLLKVLMFCKDHEIVMVMDECFLDFVSCEQEQDLSLLTYCQRYKNLIILRSFTKMYQLAGVRLGFLVTGDNLLLTKMKQYRQPWAVSNIAQAAGLAAMDEVSFVKESQIFCKDQRAYLVKELRRIGFQAYDGEANFVFFKGPEQLAQKLLEKGILIRDCSNYIGLEEGFYRIAVRSKSENQKLIQALEETVMKD